MDTSATATQWRKIILRDESILVFDHDGDKYRFAVYNRRKPEDTRPRIDAAYHDDLVRRGILPRSEHSDWYRVAANHVDLGLGLAHLQEAARGRWSPYAVRSYIEGMRWAA